MGSLIIAQDSDSVVWKWTVETLLLNRLSCWVNKSVVIVLEQSLRTAAKGSFSRPVRWVIYPERLWIQAEDRSGQPSFVTKQEEFANGISKAFRIICRISHQKLLCNSVHWYWRNVLL